MIIKRKPIDEKENVAITMDKTLLKNLEDYKKKKNIKKLSPMINEMLWDWLIKQENPKYKPSIFDQ